MNDKQQNSSTPFPQIGMQAREDQNGNRFIEGYFILFDTEMELHQGKYVKIKKGAFKKSLRYHIPVFFNGDPNAYFGVTKNGKLTLKEDDTGLWGSIKLDANDSQCMDLYEKAKAGEITQRLHACKCTTDFQNSDIVKEIELYSVSIDTFSRDGLEE